MVGDGLSTSAQLAALATGTAGHADDFDDTQLAQDVGRIYGLLTHPTVPALASTLAVAQETGATGKEFLTAFCGGFEVECKIAEVHESPGTTSRLPHHVHHKGCSPRLPAQPSYTGLSPEQTRFAIGIAASKSAGLRGQLRHYDQALSRRCSRGNGIVAAKLAGLGYQADPNALDGQWGHFQVTSGGVDAERLLDRMGNPYSLEWPGVSVKPYPCGSLSQPSMDTMLDLVLENDIKPEDVEEVRMGAGYNILNPLRYSDPPKRVGGEVQPSVLPGHTTPQAPRPAPRSSPMRWCCRRRCVR